MKVIKVPLSNQGLNDLLKKVNDLKDNLEKANAKIVDGLCDYALEEIQNNFSSTGYQDGNEDVGFFKKGTANKKSVGATGSQVLYDEFGTGTQGEQSPHPIKGKLGLRGYNTGRTIRKNGNPESSASANGVPLGALYWTYKKDGVKYYTTGIPAGKQVYNAAISLRNKKLQIVKKEVSDALSKL